MTRRVRRCTLEAGRGEEVLLRLLGLGGSGAGRFKALLTGAAPTFRAAIQLLSPNPEGTYFFYRFSDPTFITAGCLRRWLLVV